MKTYYLKWLLIVFACFILGRTSFAVPGVLSGTITNCSGGAANGAAVKLLGTNIASVATNASGAYSFNIEQGLYHLQVYKSNCGAIVQNNVNVGVSTTLNLSLPATASTANSIPDSYGYSASENGDVNGPTYSWFEISPLASGPGTSTNQGDHTSVAVSLPFTFRFYGVHYTTVYISSEGVLTFDFANNDANNTPLPNASMGHAIMAMWDNFDVTVSGGISYYYYTAQNAFIIEWYDIARFDGADTEVFQVWLYNYLTNPSPTGDGQIRMQYMQTVPAETNYAVGIQSGAIASQYYEHNNLDFTSQGLSELNTIAYGGVGGTYLSTISGTVTHCIGGPAASATVSFPSSGFPSLTTNASGFYTMSIPPGIFNVLGRKYPCSDTQISNTSVFASQPLTLNITLGSSGTLNGTVTNCSGGTAVGATMTVSAGPYTPPTQLTDANGQFSFTLPAGTYTISCTFAGCLSASAVTGLVVTAGGITTQNFVLQPFGTLQGTITSCAGGPAIGANVNITSGPTRPPVTTTDASGFYSFAGLLPGTYAESVTYSQCQSTSASGISVVSGINTRNFTLLSLGTIQGTITSCFGGTAVGATVNITSGPTRPPAQITDSNGLYSFPLLLPGTYALSITFAGCISATSTGIIISSGVVTRNVTLLAYGGISGTVSSCLGGPAVGATVTLSGGPSSSPPTTTDVNGLYSFGTLLPGTYAVTGSLVGCLNVSSTGIAVTNGNITVRNFSLNTLGTIQGIVTSCFGGSAVGTTVSVTSGPTIPLPQTSDSLGQYIFSNLLPGTYSLSVNFVDCIPAIATGISVSSGTITTRDFILTAYGAISGNIISCFGGPAVDASIALSGGPTSSPAQLTDSTGHFSFAILLPGNYNISVSYPGCIPGSALTIAVTNGNTTQQDFTLLPMGSLQGTVISCTGGPAIGATVSLSGGPMTPTPVTTDSTGFYTFANLLPGTYIVSVLFPGCGDIGNLVVISSGNITTQNVTLVTDPRFFCSPPDAYGYYACENVDLTGPLFQFRAVAPHQLGSGTAVTGFLDNNFVGPLTLPFPVKFYGNTYTQYYIGENGFITFGAGSTNGTNLCFPQPTMPAGLYPYWDNMFPTLAVQQIAIDNNLVDHQFTIEFYQADHAAPRGTLETFECVIYDQTYYPTQTGDNDILFLYDSLGITNSCTVGIMANGSLFHPYQCNGVTEATAVGIANSRSILFSTNPPCNGNSELSLSTPTINNSVPILYGLVADSFQLCNTGTCPLKFHLSFSETSPVLLNSGRAEDNPLDNVSGADSFGYRWKDSHEPDGPIYNWQEIRSVGVNTGLQVDDGFASVSFPWSFPFYGINYDSVKISVNGNLQLNSTNSDIVNVALPNTSLPNAIIAPYWSNLTTASSGNIYYYDDTAHGRFIVEWDSVEHFLSNGVYSFQVILYPYGDILMQYRNLIGDISNSTVGIENSSGTVGLTAIFNGAYLSSGLAIRLYVVPIWLTIGGQSYGIINPGLCTNIPITFNTQYLGTGIYNGQILVENNSPLNSVNIPVTFSVTELNAPDSLTIKYNPVTNTLTFRWLPNGFILNPLYSIYSALLPDGPFITLEGTTAATSLTIPFTPVTRVRHYHVVVQNASP